MSSAETTPQKVFCRHSRLNYSEVVGYKADNTMTWFAVTGLLPQVSFLVSTSSLPIWMAFCCFRTWWQM